MRPDPTPGSPGSPGSPTGCQPIQHRISVFRPKGVNGGHCSYCDGPDTFVTYGVWAEQLDCGDFQSMLDKGWRRFGQYCWHPENERVCCPLYAIRVNTRDFTPSRGQRKVWKRLERYIRLGPSTEGELRGPSRSRSKIRRGSTDYDPPPRSPSPPGRFDPRAELVAFARRALLVAVRLWEMDDPDSAGQAAPDCPDVEVLPTRSVEYGDWNTNLCWRLDSYLRIRAASSGRKRPSAAATAAAAALRVPGAAAGAAVAGACVAAAAAVGSLPPGAAAPPHGHGKRRRKHVDSEAQSARRGVHAETYQLVDTALSELRHDKVAWPPYLRDYKIEHDGHINLWVDECARPTRVRRQQVGRTGRTLRRRTSVCTSKRASSAASRKSRRAEIDGEQPDRCPRGHPWQFGLLTKPEHYETVICDVCLLNGLQHHERGYHHCPHCLLDKCLDCKWEQVPRCPRNLSHRMRYLCLTSPEDYKLDPICDFCTRSDLKSDKRGYYHCQHCSIDVHRECNFRPPRCGCGAHMTFLCLQLPATYPGDKLVCDVCQQCELQTDAKGYWHCGRCMIDIHRSCSIENRAAHIRNSIDGKTVWRYEGKRTIEVRIINPVADSETLALFRLYQSEVHHEQATDVLAVLRVGGEAQASAMASQQQSGEDVQVHRAFSDFLVRSPLFYDAPVGLYGTFHIQYRLDGQLFMVTVIDILPRCVNSVYCMYDPKYRWFQPGKLSVMYEMEWIRKQTFNMDLRYYYLGMYVHSAPKMSYKAQYKPSELKCHESHVWLPFDSVKPALDAHAGPRGDRYFRFCPDAEEPQGDPEEVFQVLSAELWSSEGSRRKMWPLPLRDALPLLDPSELGAVREFSRRMTVALDGQGPAALLVATKGLERTAEEDEVLPVLQTRRPTHSPPRPQHPSVRPCPGEHTAALRAAPGSYGTPPRSPTEDDRGRSKARGRSKGAGSDAPRKRKSKGQNLRKTEAQKPCDAPQKTGGPAAPP
eukprot:TRINITY_DN17728_c0_g1_i1.p1 TRINITY_DN17728_c0_g1~~TRINITY_DN17728_c0_g1_i1.p1  ORF type:complete len:1017 (+),score=327.29 TRINITY_DN17728_c0_g1_i1:100-3051(+)